MDFADPSQEMKLRGSLSTTNRCARCTQAEHTPTPLIFCQPPQALLIMLDHSELILKLAFCLNDMTSAKDNVECQHIKLLV